MRGRGHVSFRDGPLSFRGDVGEDPLGTLPSLSEDDDLNVRGEDDDLNVLDDKLRKHSSLSRTMTPEEVTDSNFRSNFFPSIAEENDNTFTKRPRVQMQKKKKKKKKKKYSALI
eukprot:Trichotokara_eunicae@DN9548_c0_g1_i1.p1